LTLYILYAYSYSWNVPLCRVFYKFMYNLSKNALSHVHSLSVIVVYVMVSVVRYLCNDILCTICVLFFSRISMFFINPHVYGVFCSYCHYRQILFHPCADAPSDKLNRCGLFLIHIFMFECYKQQFSEKSIISIWLISHKNN